MDKHGENHAEPLRSAPTLAPSGTGSALGPGSVPQAGVALVEGSGPKLTHETETLLRVRLRAATLILFGALAIGFLLGLVRRGGEFGWLSVMSLGVCAMFGGACALVSSRRALSLVQLRVVELVVFGALTALVFTSQSVHIPRAYHQMQNADWPLRIAEMKVVMRGTVFPYFAIMVIYGMFIPNTWSRAACVVAPIVAAPAVLVLTMAVQYPLVAEVARQRAASYALMLLVGAACAIYGTHVINALRREAFEAKKFGRYQLGKRLGIGGMGEVYLAEHQLLKRPCAIKLIRPEHVQHPNALARFEREVRSCAKLSHWNTVEVYDYGRTDDGVFYYVMEFLPGMNLHDLVSRHGPMPPERAIHLLRQTCQALREAHAAGLIHRDIKPANIFAAERGGVYDVAKLLDFGLVKPLADVEATQLTQVGMIAGSLLYISPEQALGDYEPEPRTDIYSLGAVAYYLLTGRPPFEGKTAASLVVAHARDEVAPPSTHRPDLPTDLGQVVLRCLEKDPEDRYPDAASLDAALGACQDADKWPPERAARWWDEFGATGDEADAADAPVRGGTPHAPDA